MVSPVMVDELGACLESLQLDGTIKSCGESPRYRYISLDLETTSLMPSKGRIIELAAVDIDSGDFYETLINPAPVVLSKKTCGITGIRACDVVAPGVPNYPTAFTGFLDFVERCRREGETVVLVAHNGARFDFLYLRNECARNGLELPEDWLFVDTLLLAQHFGLKEEVDGGSLSQDSLRAWLKVPEPVVKHRALPDAQVLAAMFPLLLDKVGSPSMSELLAKRKRLAGLLCSVAINIHLEPDTSTPLHKMLLSLLPSTRVFTAREFVRSQLESMIQCCPSSNNNSLFQLYNISSSIPVVAPSNSKEGSPLMPSPLYVLLQGVRIECSIHKTYAYKDDGVTPYWNLLLGGESADCTDALAAFGLACDALTRQCDNTRGGKLHSVLKPFNGTAALKVSLRTKLQDDEVTLNTHIHDMVTGERVLPSFLKYESRDPEHVSTVRTANVSAVNSSLKRHTTCDVVLCPEFLWSSRIGYGVKLTVVHVFLNGGKNQQANDEGPAKARSVPPAVPV